MNALTPDDIEALTRAAGVFANESIGDKIYDIREREGEGWEGPRVMAWGEASEIIDRLRKENKI